VDSSDKEAQNAAAMVGAADGGQPLAPPACWLSLNAVTA
jgi:hypothetical protein